MNVRPWRPGDQALLVAAQRELSPASLSSRFFVGTSTLPVKYLRYVAHAPRDRWDAQVATQRGRLPGRAARSRPRRAGDRRVAAARGGLRVDRDHAAARGRRRGTRGARRHRPGQRRRPRDGPIRVRGHIDRHLPGRAAALQDGAMRHMWTLFEPIHDVTYFHPAARAAFEQAGLRGFWRGYFAGRAAPLGPVPAGPVIGAFFGFAPHMVERALPDVWTRISPEAALAARLRGAVDALGPFAADTLPPDRLAEAVELIEAAVAELDPAGRVLGAANAALPRPEGPLARLWQATTTLREHRGDGHVAALVVAGLTGCQSIVLRSGLDLPRELTQVARGWSDEDWNAAAARLVKRGWLDDDGRITGAGRQGYQKIEETTDALAAVPWHALGPEPTARLADLLYPLAAACHGALPAVTPLGVPVPSGRG